MVTPMSRSEASRVDARKKEEKLLLAPKERLEHHHRMLLAMTSAALGSAVYGGRIRPIDDSRSFPAFLCPPTP